MLRMADTQPGDKGRLAEPPSNRYAVPGSSGSPGAAPERSALPGPLARALIVAVAGAVALIVVAAIVGSTVGLLAISGIVGASAGLVLARAAVPAGDVRPVSRRSVTWLAVGLAVGAVLIADVVTWLYARQEGGTLGLLDYLLTTFGPFVPGEAIIAALGAAWGANAGPVQG
jgi:hypothetical protein